MIQLTTIQCSIRILFYSICCLCYIDVKITNNDKWFHFVYTWNEYLFENFGKGTVRCAGRLVNHNNLQINPVMITLNNNELQVFSTVGKSRKENPQKLTQLSSRSHPRHLVGKRTAQKDITIDTTSDSQVNSNFPNKWSPASLTFNNYFYLFLHLYIT